MMKETERDDLVAEAPTVPEELAEPASLLRAYLERTQDLLVTFRQHLDGLEQQLQLAAPTPLLHRALRDRSLILDPFARNVRLLPQGIVLDLNRRRAVRFILLAFVHQHLTAPGTPLTVDDLLDAGWPESKISGSRSPNRVHVALSILRKAGLKDLIITRDTGYLLEPSLSVQFTDGRRPNMTDKGMF